MIRYRKKSYQVDYCCTKEKIEREDQIQVRVVAQLLRNVCYEKKSTSNCGFICAGWDIFHGGQIYAIVQGGTLINIPFVSSSCKNKSRQSMKFIP